MVRRSDRATITDVARAAKVSVSTVSRVINGNPTVDPELAERVRETAATLGYSADPLARSLVLGRTQTIAVVVPDLANPTFQSMLRGISRAAALDGYHVLVADSDEQTEAERGLALATRRRTDGVLLVAPRMSTEELTALVDELRPTVVVNRAALPDTPVVAVDYRSALSELIEHLRGLGHRRMMYLAGAERSVSNAARLAAIDEARLADPSLEITVRPTGVDFDSGVAATDAVVESGATGVLAFNDLVAMGLVSGLGEHGIRVPEQVSVVGFDDIPFARHTTPPLTTASVPSTDVGADAWAAMRMLLDGDEPTPFAVHVPSVITRASSGPAPA